MRIVLLGTAGYHPCERRHTPCMLIAECGVMLDAGTGVFRAGPYLQGQQLDIFLTHAHLDHVIGLTYLWSLLQVHRLERVRVHGMEEHLAAVEQHLFAEPLFPARPPCQFVPLRGEEPLPGSGRLTYFRVEHPGGAVGFRLDWPGHCLAYVTDTTASPEAAYLDRIRGVDLLLHECYLPDAQAQLACQTGHSHTSAVAELARRAGVGRLVLIHISPLAPDDDPIGIQTAQALFPQTILGKDRMEIDF